MKNQEPLVTIGVASYNNASYIKETLDSIANQSYSKIEIIINDDASTDYSIQVIYNWLAENKNLNVQLIENRENQGLCKALNNIINCSNGNFISLIASDDKYLDDFVSNRVKVLLSMGADIGICYSRTYLIDENSKRIGLEEREKWLQGDIFEDLCSLSNSFCKPLTTMVKREVYEKVGLYDEKLLYEDLDFFFRAAKMYKVAFLESVDTEYRILNNSLGSKLNSTVKGLESTSEIIRKNFGNSEKADLSLSKRLRKVALKKRNLKINSWKADFRISIKYNPNVRDRIYYLIYLVKSWVHI